MTNTSDSSWVVLKFGGTSVSSVSNWKNVAGVVHARLAEGLHPVVVHSALSGITDRLEQLLAKALTGDWEPVMEQIERRHVDLARDLGVAVCADLERHFTELRKSAAGIHLIGEVSDRLRARVMATGELMATRIGAAYLASDSIDVQWLDARTLLHAEERPGASDRAGYLSATCNFEPDPALQQRLATGGKVVITQGFIASDAKGDTVLLGRGGSDTSGSYFAAKLGAKRLEIWTDVPGMFTANPRAVPNARLLKSLDYDEAQEIASSGAKVLHPRCILPAKHYAIPLSVHATHMPELEGTVVTATGGDGGARVKAVCSKKGITLLSMETLGMWHQVGFLADAFVVFKEHGLSVDLVSTSETSVTVSLDPAANTLDSRALEALVASLSRLCRVEVIGPCAAVSLVGRSIRATLHRLGDALELFEEQRIYLVTQAANDLNITFVVDEEQGDRLVSRLHDVIVRNAPSDHVLGPHVGADPRARPDDPGRRSAVVAGTPGGARGHRARARLCLRVRQRDARADRPPAARDRRCRAGVLRDEGQPAPGDPAHLRRARSRLRVRLAGRVRTRARGRARHRPRQGAVHAEFRAPRPSTSGRSRRACTSRSTTCIRCATGRSCSAVATSSSAWTRASAAATTTTCAPRACTRSSGFRSSSSTSSIGWSRRPAHGSSACTPTRAAASSTCATGARSGNCSASSPSVSPRCGRSISAAASACPRSPGRCRWTSPRCRACIDDLRTRWPGLGLWLEPGRFLVAQAGVLVAQVTQLKGKGTVQYVGVTTGMNSLIRPALYGAHHDIVNLTRFGEPGREVYNVVGPICESADYLGHERLLPPTAEGDTLLIANAGAYGHVMSSWYNLREPAREILI